MGCLKILIVDDNPEVRLLLFDFLSGEGHQCRKAACAGEALLIIPDFAPHLILTDFLMPEVTGIELLKAVRERHPQIRAMLLTGHADVENTIAAIDFGVRAVFEKPLQLSQVAKRIRAVALEIQGELKEDLDRRFRLKAERQLRLSNAVLRYFYQQRTHAGDRPWSSKQGQQR